jgi:glycerol-3-phosphate acyltransferase PlsX
MGGDHAPAHPVDGAVAAARNLGLGIDLVGREDLIRAELARHPDAGDLDVRVIDAPDVIEMSESPAKALRKKPRASIRVAAEHVAAVTRPRCSAPATPARAWSRRTRRLA